MIARDWTSVLGGLDGNTD